MKSLIKQPAETIHEPMTFGGVATISALISVGAVSRGLVAGSAALTVTTVLFADALTLEISGGTDGELYLITAIADDDDDQRREEEVEVSVIDYSWAMPDGGAPMLSIADFVAMFTLEEVVRITDHLGNGRIGKDLLVGALVAAQAQVEAHISARYQLPLSTVPELIRTAIADIARARLYTGEAPKGVGDQAKAALRTLERIQSGAMPLPGAPPAAAATSETPILFHSGGRAYPDGLADF